MNKTISISISGKVQGVWFRKYSQQKAQELKLNGSVQNLPDDSVLIFVTGTNEHLESFTKWCWQGSPKSKVVHVAVQQMELKKFTGFVIE